MTLPPLPYYKWFWQDFRASRTVQRMTYIQRGLYRDLLDECWAEGCIPNDQAKLADICGCPEEVMASAWQVLSKCFIEILPGRLVNERLNTERTEKDKERVSRKFAGASGGRARSTSIASAKQVLASAKHMPYRREEKSIEKDMSKAAPDGAVDVWVSRLCEVWPRKQYDGSSAPYTSSTKVRSLYERTLKTREANGEELAMCAFLYTQDMAKTKRYVKALATFLGPQKVWLDYLSQARERITHQEAV